MINVNITSERKGGNPGGYCEINGIKYYIKFAHSGSLPKESPFRAGHQPIYEALTCKLDRHFGLATPRTYVLQANGTRINAEHYKDFSKLKNNYFLSKVVGPGIVVDPKLPSFQAQKPTRRLLLLGDVSNRGDNSLQLQDGTIVYIDLGASFVDATNGILGQRNNVRKLAANFNRKNLKNASAGNLRIYDGTGIPLDLSVIDNLDKVQIPIFPNQSLPLEKLLCSDEIDMIRFLLSESAKDVDRAYR